MMTNINAVNTFEKVRFAAMEAFPDDKPLLPLEKSSKHYSFEKHVCSTCKQEIDSEISRILIMSNKDMGPRLFCFHFFFPCWNLELLFQKYPNLTIDHVAFSFPEHMKISEYSVNDMQINPEYWAPKQF